MDRLRVNLLMFAEAIDAWRVVPRLMLLFYGYLVFQLYIWYKNIPSYVQEKCDSAILNVLLTKGIPLVEAKQVACTVADVVGGPTAAQSAFVTTIIGLSTGIFGLYASTGRKWENWEPPATVVRRSIDVNAQTGEVQTTTVTKGRQHETAMDRVIQYADVPVTIQDAPKTNVNIYSSEVNVGPEASDVESDVGDGPKP